jgi:hypothetical protein
MAQTGIQPDIEQGLGAGDEHLIIPSTGFLIDLTGLEPGPQQVQYAFVHEAAQTGLGDNDGELDFADTVANFPCFATGTLIRTPDGDCLVETL